VAEICHSNNHHKEVVDNIHKVLEVAYKHMDKDAAVVDNNIEEVAPYTAGAFVALSYVVGWQTFVIVQVKMVSFKKIEEFTIDSAYFAREVNSARMIKSLSNSLVFIVRFKAF
jgi:hypothetical protein